MHESTLTTWLDYIRIFKIYKDISIVRIKFQTPHHGMAAQLVYAR